MNDLEKNVVEHLFGVELDQLPPGPYHLHVFGYPQEGAADFSPENYECYPIEYIREVTGKAVDFDDDDFVERVDYGFFVEPRVASADTFEELLEQLLRMNPFGFYYSPDIEEVHRVSLEGESLFSELGDGQLFALRLSGRRQLFELQSFFHDEENELIRECRAIGQQVVCWWRPISPNADVGYSIRRDL